MTPENGWCRCAEPDVKKSKLCDVCVTCGGVPMTTVKKVSFNYHAAQVAELTNTRDALRVLSDLTEAEVALVRRVYAALRAVQRSDDQDGDALDVLDGLASRLKMIEGMLTTEHRLMDAVYGAPPYDS